MKKNLLLFSYIIVFLIISISFVFASDDAPPALPSEHWGLVDNGNVADSLTVTGEINSINYAQPSQTLGGYYDILLVGGDRELTYNNDRDCSVHWAAGEACVPCDNESDCIEGPQDGAEVSIKIDSTEASPKVTWLNGSSNRQDLILIIIYDLPLYTGWNLISLPIQPQDTTIENLLTGLSGQVVVWYYNASGDEWTVYDTNAPFPWLNTLHNIDYGKAYWLKSTINQILTAQGNIITDYTIGLKPGWNFVGYNMSTGIMPSPISGLTTPIVAWAYHTAEDEWKVYDTEAPFPWLNTLTNMTAGKGYWLKSSINQDWKI